MKTITKEVKVVSISFKNLIKKSFSLKGFFDKAKKVVSNLGKIAKKLIVKASAIAIVYTDKLVDFIKGKINDFEMWLYIKLDEKFKAIAESVPEGVFEVLEDIIE